MDIIFEEGRLISGQPPDKDFVATMVPRLEVVPGRSETKVFPDVVVDVTFPEVTITALDVVVTGNTRELKVVTTRPEYVNVTGLTARKILDFNGITTPVSLVVSTEYGARSYRIDLPGDMPIAEQSTAGTHVAGSFGAQVTALMRAEFEGVTPGATSQDLFLDGGTYTADPAPASVTVNPTRILQGMDMSCVSVSRSTGIPGNNNHRFPVELVSPRHVVCNSHCGVSAGQNVCFRQRNGTIQTVTVLGHLDLGQDLRVAILDQDVMDCAFCVTMPSDIAEYAPGSTRAAYDSGTIYGSGAIPVVVRHGNPGELPGRFLNNYIGTNSPHLRVQWVRMWQGYQMTTALKSLADDPLYPYHNPGYGGDSGSPVFLLVPQTAGGYITTLLTSLYSADSGPSYPHRRLDINTAMASLSSVHGEARTFEMGVISISSFPKFPAVT